ncbi:branched-chain amino acid ABC transporter permease [Enterococcus timonensis]|uniref:branched-chain amino acid ABC transporter permease n=1 Tax=Enterococcus timonensis TaxID=1852364 RepID=UPI0008D9FCB4|nr:branched-chain amino acid ABC transporter permease [Enterococcus timonensis]
MKKNLRVNLYWCGLFLCGYLLLYMLQAVGLFNLFFENTFVFIGINIILAVGLNLIIGFSGQFSLGHAGFMAIGAYGTALFLQQHQNMTGLISGLIIGMTLSGAVAFLVGGPTLRLKGDYLAIATLGVSEIIRIIIINLPTVTNGAAGIFQIPNLVTWPMVYGAVIASTLIIVNFIHSGTGLTVQAIAQDEIAAESVGINTTRYKLTAFVIGAITAALAGGLYASYLQTITPKDFTFNKSIDILIIVVFGGIGSITGSIVAAIVLGILNMFLQDFGQLRMIIYALALIIMMLFKPNGLLGKKEFSLGQLLKKKVRS